MTPEVMIGLGVALEAVAVVMFVRAVCRLSQVVARIDGRRR